MLRGLTAASRHPHFTHTFDFVLLGRCVGVGVGGGGAQSCAPLEALQARARPASRRRRAARTPTSRRSPPVAARNHLRSPPMPCDPPSPCRRRRAGAGARIPAARRLRRRRRLRWDRGGRRGVVHRLPAARAGLRQARELCARPAPPPFSGLLEAGGSQRQRALNRAPLFIFCRRTSASRAPPPPPPRAAQVQEQRARRRQRRRRPLAGGVHLRRRRRRTRHRVSRR